MTMDIAKQISKEYADKNTCYANDSDLQYRAIRKAVEYGYEQAKKQLMANAINAHATSSLGSPCIAVSYWADTCLTLGDKCKVIVIKED